MVDNIWTEFARSYDRITPETSSYRRMLAKILRDTKGCRYVIDAGCGTGLVSQPLVKRGQEVVGFDNNPAMLSQAQVKWAALSEEARRRWRLMEGNVMTFPPEVPGEADAVVLNNVLFYVREPEQALRECMEHLAPGGVLIATGPKRRPDLQKLIKGTIAEWQAEGRWSDSLRAAAAYHAELSSRLVSDPNEMVTFFEVDALVDTLRHLGLSHARVADGDDYYGENYYVCMVR